MPLIGSIFVVIIVIGVGLAGWGLLPKVYDKTANHFDLDKNEKQKKETCECENCECKEKEKTKYEKL